MSSDETKQRPIEPVSDAATVGTEKPKRAYWRDFYAEEGKRQGRAPKSIKNSMSLFNGLTDALGQDFVMEHVNGSKIDTRRGWETIIRLRKQYSQEAVRKFVLQHKDTGFPKWLAATPDSPLGLIARGLRNTTPAERREIRDILIGWCERDDAKAAKSHAGDTMEEPK